MQNTHHMHKGAGNYNVFFIDNKVKKVLPGCLSSNGSGSIL